MGKQLREPNGLKIKTYLNGNNQSIVSIKSDANIFETPVIVLQFPEEGKIVFRRAGIDDKTRVQNFSKAYNIWQMHVTTELVDGMYENEPDESDTDTMTYYLTE